MSRLAGVVLVLAGCAPSGSETCAVTESRVAADVQTGGFTADQIRATVVGVRTYDAAASGDDNVDGSDELMALGPFSIEVASESGTDAIIREYEQNEAWPCSKLDSSPFLVVPATVRITSSGGALDVTGPVEILGVDPVQFGHADPWGDLAGSVPDFALELAEGELASCTSQGVNGDASTSVVIGDAVDTPTLTLMFRTEGDCKRSGNLAVVNLSIQPGG